MKKCTSVNCKTKTEQPLDNFEYKNNRHSKMCKKCIVNARKYNKEYREKNKIKISKKKKDYYSNNKIKSGVYTRPEKVTSLKCSNKKCVFFNTLQSSDNFYFYTHSGKYYSRCKKCYNSSDKKERHKKWVNNNMQAVLKRQRQYINNRKKTDALYKLRRNISSSISANLTKNGESCLNYLPYSIQELKKYLESKFEPWMNWHNYGSYIKQEWDDNDPKTWKWNIDHIIPQSGFKFNSMKDEEFENCWALNNLRPYSAKKNLLENNRRSL